MEVGSSGADKFRSYNGLVCLAQAITGYKTTVDLRDGSSVTGTLVQTDSYMNIIMHDALFRDCSGQPRIFESFFVHNRNVRYVHIPVEVDMIKSMKNFFARSQGHQGQPQKTGFKERNLLKRQAETLKLVQEMTQRKKDATST